MTIVTSTTPVGTELLILAGEDLETDAETEEASGPHSVGPSKVDPHEHPRGSRKGGDRVGSFTEHRRGAVVHLGHGPQG